MKRINIHEVAPEAYQPMIELEKWIASTGFDRKIYELIKMRASQINGCHYCINMHSRDAMKAGETAQRLFLLDAWRECGDMYSPREQAALALTEEMTHISHGGVSDAVYDEAAKQFSPKELATLMMGIVAINGWNRMAISTHQALD